MVGVAWAGPARAEAARVKAVQSLVRGRVRGEGWALHLSLTPILPPDLSALRLHRLLLGAAEHLRW